MSEQKRAGLSPLHGDDYKAYFVYDNNVLRKTFGVSRAELPFTESVQCQLQITVNSKWTIHEAGDWGLDVFVNGTEAANIRFNDDSDTGTTVQKSVELAPFLVDGKNSVMVKYHMLTMWNNNLYRGHIWLIQGGKTFVDDEVTSTASTNGAWYGSKEFFFNM